MAKQRLDYVDLLKGLGIVCVILGHARFPGSLRALIYIFHMPLFFFLSGYVHNSGISMRSFALKRVKTLLYPYYVIGILYILHNTLLDVVKQNFEWGGVWKRVAALLYGNYIWDNNASYIGTLWFLAALFCVEIIFEFLRRGSFKFEKADRALFGMILGAVAAGCIIARLINATRVLTADNSGYRLPYCLDIALVAVFFYYVGYEIRRHNDLISKSAWNRVLTAAVLGFFGVVLGALNYFITDNSSDMLYLRFGIEPLFLLAASGISIGLLLMCSVLCEKWRSPLLKSFGKHSLLIMAVHIPLMTYLNKAFEIAGVGNAIVYDVFLMMIAWGISLFVAQFLPWIYRCPQRQGQQL